MAAQGPNASPVRWVVKRVMRPDFDLGPFGMGARQAGPAGSVAKLCENAGELGFLATHDSARRRRQRRRGQARGGAAPSRMESRSARERVGGAGGAGEVGRLDPALAAADHAGEQDVALPDGEPGADFLAQGVGEASVRHRHDAAGHRSGRMTPSRVSR